MTICAGNLWKAGLWQSGLWKGGLWGAAGFNSDPYNFYVDFPSLTDKVSGNQLTTALSATRYGYAGGAFGEDVPVIESGKLLTNGAYTQLIKKSEDISDGVWTKTNVSVVSDSVLAPDGTLTGDTFMYNGIVPVVSQILSYTDATPYFNSFHVKKGNYRYAAINIWSGSFGATTYVVFDLDLGVVNYVAAGVTGSYGIEDIGDGWFLLWYKQTSIAASTGPIKLNMAADGALSGGSTGDYFYFWGAQVTASPYRLPYVPNATTGTISVPLNYSDADERIKAIGMAANFPQLLDALDGVAEGVDLLTSVKTLGTHGGWVADGNGVYSCDGTQDQESAIIFNLSDTLDGKHWESNLDVLTITGGTIVAHLGTAWSPALSVGSHRNRNLGNLSAVEIAIVSADVNFIGSIKINSVKEISPAKGRMTIPWTPRFDAADVSGVVHILTANDDATSFLFYNGATQEIHAYDGTNTAVVACTPVNGTEYQIILDYGDNAGQKMRLMADSTVGTAVTHAGSFPITADDLSIAWNEEVPQEVDSIIILKEPSW